MMADHTSLDDEGTAPYRGGVHNGATLGSCWQALDARGDLIEQYGIVFGFVLVQNGIRGKPGLQFDEDPIASLLLQ